MKVDWAAKFIRANKIDSFQKLRLLLFIYQHPSLNGTSQELAQQLYLGDSSILENIITDLTQVGLLNHIGNHFILCNDPDTRSSLECISRLFEDPLARQGILDQVRQPQPVYQPAA